MRSAAGHLIRDSPVYGNCLQQVSAPTLRECAEAAVLPHAPWIAKSDLCRVRGAEEQDCVPGQAVLRLNLEVHLTGLMGNRANPADKADE